LHLIPENYSTEQFVIRIEPAISRMSAQFLNTKKSVTYMFSGNFKLSVSAFNGIQHISALAAFVFSVFGGENFLS
jgi:hypothetical protein